MATRFTKTFAVILTCGVFSLPASASETNLESALSNLLANQLSVVSHKVKTYVANGISESVEELLEDGEQVIADLQQHAEKHEAEKKDEKPSITE